MDELGLFTAALGLSAPWRVTRTEFDGAQLDLYLDFPRGARFSCLVKDCIQDGCAVHDTAEKTWRHMDFFLSRPSQAPNDIKPSPATGTP